MGGRFHPAGRVSRARPMFPEHDLTRERLVLRLMDLQRRGQLDQVELCDALRAERAMGWLEHDLQLNRKVAALPWGLRQLVAHWVQSPGESPQAGPPLDRFQSPPHCRQR